MADSNILEVLLRSLISTIKRAFAGKVDKHVFPSLTGPFKQSLVPSSVASISDFPTDPSQVRQKFNLGAWEPVAGNYVAFALIDNLLNAVECTYSGSAWSWTKATVLSAGAIAFMKFGAASSLEYQSKVAFQNSQISIFNAVAPLIGKIPLEHSISGETVTVDGLKGADISIKGAPSGDRIIIWLNNTRDTDILTDTSEVGTSSSGESAFILSIAGDNAGQIPTCIANGTKIDFYDGGWSDTVKKVSFNPLVAISVVTDADTGPRPGIQADFAIRHPSLKYDNGDQYRMDVLLKANGTSPELVFLPVLEKAATQASAATPMMAKAAMLAASGESGERNLAFPKAADGSSGIFVEKDGRPFDLIMNEYAD